MRFWATAVALAWLALLLPSGQAQLPDARRYAPRRGSPVGAPSFVVTPSRATVAVNATHHFTATLAGVPIDNVIWYVNDIPGGTPETGTIDTGGVYLAPGAVPAAPTVTIKAMSPVGSFAVSSVQIVLPTSNNYPRSDAASVLKPTPPLPLLPTTGARVAILDWRSKDSSATPEDLLALCHTLTVLGIPHVHTSVLAEAASYPLLAIAGVPDSLTSADRTGLLAYANGGGTLLLWRIADSALLTSLGISGSVSYSQTTSRPLTFDLQTGDAGLRFIDAEPEINWQLQYPSYGYTRGYTATSATVLAHWATGDAALLRSQIGSGRAYLFGWRLRQVVAEAERAVSFGPEPPWTNEPVLDADICRLLLRGIYEGWAGAGAPLRNFAPEGKRAALILTHDADSTQLYANVPNFMQVETAHGVKSTFLFTTSPYSNGWISGIYSNTGKQVIAQVSDAGFDIASHTFGHFPDFQLAPSGTGAEDAGVYLPHYSTDLTHSTGVSAIGETGVSRWLLEGDFGIVIEGFRAGHLMVPPSLPDALSRTGYRRDSSFTGGMTRGSFPYPRFSTETGFILYPVMEYPIAISDHGLEEATFEATLEKWLTLIRINADNNAPTVLLIHPSSDATRQQALEAILDRIAGLDLWVGDWKSFATFWEAQGVECPYNTAPVPVTQAAQVAAPRLPSTGQNSRSNTPVKALARKIF